MIPSRHYDLRARDYASEPHRGFYTSIASDLLNLIPATTPKRVLEVGCGSGFSTDVLVKQFPDADIVAMDPAMGMLDIARDRLGDACTFTDNLSSHGEFDMIVSSMSLHWTTSGDRRAIIDRLSPGGLLCIAAPGRLDGPRAQGNELLLDSVKWVRRSHPGPLPETSRGYDCDSISQLFPTTSHVNCTERITQDSSEATVFPETLDVRGALLALFGDTQRIETALSRLKVLCQDRQDNISTLWPIIHFVSQGPR